MIVLFTDAASDDDMEQPVFDFEDDGDDIDDGDDDDDDETQLKGLAAKIARQQKFLRQKIGGVEDEMHDDAEEEEERRKAVWGRRKNLYYNADNVDYELQSSDEDLPAEEEAEVLRLQREKAKSLRMEDFGLEDEDEDESDSDGPVKTLQDAFVEKRTTEKFHADEVTDDGTVTAYEEIKKDLNALTKEEQMDVVYSSAPELVGLLSELSDALNELENKVNPLQSKVNENKNVTKGGMHYVEVKRLLLLVYCQAISFYLLLKTEGHSVRDHPVIARLVEIKGMLDKVKQIDGTLPSQIDEILNHEHGIVLEAEPAKENAALELELRPTSPKLPFVSVKKHEGAPMQASEIAELVKVSLSKDCESKDSKNKRQNDQVGLQSMEMLKVRERLEEKLKQKGLYGSVGKKNDRIRTHPLQLTSRPLETLDDFDDEVIDKAASHQASNKGDSSSLHLNKLSQLVSVKVKKPKLVSGDDDLPARDDIGERRRKYELQVLAKAGAAAMDDIGDEDGVLVSAEADELMDIDEDVESKKSEDDFYKQVKQQRAAKLAAKAEIYLKTPAVPSLPESVVDGKRQITYQMDKNRGLTRARKKLTKIPRKKYKLKHQKAVVRRKGQVRDIRKPSGPYGGEASGINTGISRSIRFES
ncbi:protein THALLO isoform X2 [Magnolia sinica]|uniref:protein THALLO isoform X2 n=1 Tax=Magnolia sinica TaxID=86752 RepID=UPI002658D642|nr:protein THALLO isoform X2 [Magnolia sinica]